MSADDLTPDEAARLLRNAFAKPRGHLVVSFNIDPVPGWGDNINDWQILVQRLLNDAVGHYNPTVEVLS